MPLDRVHSSLPSAGHAHHTTGVMRRRASSPFAGTITVYLPPTHTLTDTSRTKRRRQDSRAQNEVRELNASKYITHVHRCAGWNTSLHARSTSRQARLTATTCRRAPTHTSPPHTQRCTRTPPPLTCEKQPPPHVMLATVAPVLMNASAHEPSERGLPHTFVVVGDGAAPAARAHGLTERMCAR